MKIESALIVFINQDIYEKRENYYKNLVKEKFNSKDYKSVFLIGLDKFNLIRSMDWITPKSLSKDFWYMPFTITELARSTIEGITLEFKKVLIDRLNHIKCSQINYCFDYCLSLSYDNVNGLIENLKHEGYKIQEISITDIISKN